MSIKRVFSAGGVVLRLRSEPSAVNANNLEVLVTQHSKHKGWDFPKGHLEPGESSEQAAMREVEEETGVKGEVIANVGQTQYFYWEGKEKVFKTVTFFLMKYAGVGEATTAYEVSGKVWLPPEEVEGKLTFADTKKLWKRAFDMIEKLK